ncbi:MULTISPECIES: phosphoheptose isomerase [unclassified Uliginosibacterium]|uniref:phosphoheptose isomerase n=1 Tax=unclassified Uliginosibacterium TaxID=2621521 RepID=UPI000C7B0C2E|nr:MULTISPECIES: phosphoheptose isomerase [unclassified Uliginosibacterium]MDO6387457.1 phosphoheptose isomerase [Uliginosibacterium sp. 31-12]PLK47082.1 phosphoheptose isomerase [Uliginosibacterium sp. TH139]
MDLASRIALHFEDSAQTKLAAAEQLSLPLADAAELMVQTLLSNGKILACGNGGSAADAQHFASELIGRYERERPELAAIALSVDSSTMSAIANDYSWEQVYAKQVRALGQPHDVLLAISTSGDSPNILAAIEAAHERDLRVVALTGKGGGMLAGMLREGDVHVCVPHERTARIQEIHLLAIHCICDGIDCLLMGEE